jgi:hypothetical protein
MKYSIESILAAKKEYDNMADILKDTFKSYTRVSTFAISDTKKLVFKLTTKASYYIESESVMGHSTIWYNSVDDQVTIDTKIISNDYMSVQDFMALPDWDGKTSLTAETVVIELGFKISH